jgi:hypothetical protein
MLSHAKYVARLLNDENSLRAVGAAHASATD